MNSAPFRVRLHLLGVPRVELHGAGDVSGELPAKGIALLAFLSLRGETSRQKLAALLWPPSQHGQEVTFRTANRSQAAVRQVISRLRATLGPDAIIGVHTAKINPDIVWSDAVELVNALEEQRFADFGGLWRGHLCTGLEQVAGREWSTWLEDTNSSLCVGLASELQRQAEKHARANEWRDAVALLRVCLKVQPQELETGLALVTALLGCGDVHGARSLAAAIARDTPSDDSERHRVEAAQHVAEAAPLPAPKTIGRHRTWTSFIPRRLGRALVVVAAALVMLVALATRKSTGLRSARSDVSLQHRAPAFPVAWGQPLDRADRYAVRLRPARMGPSDTFLGFGLPGAYCGDTVFIREVRVRIPAHERWTTTGLDVHAGCDVVKFDAAGWVAFDTDGDSATPAGRPDIREPIPYARVPDAPVQSLVCRFGPFPPFLVGTHRTVEVLLSGVVECGINESMDINDVYRDNGGSWTLRVRVQYNLLRYRPSRLETPASP